MSIPFQRLSYALPFLIVLIGCQTQSTQQPLSSTDATTLTAVPAAPAVTANGLTLTGKLIYHSYATYGFTGVHSWLTNFDTGTTTDITPSRVRGAMNYHFNQNGTEVVFMGDDGNISGDEWDIWIASVGSAGLSNVTKITPTDGSRNEDVKFSSDGTKIIFKKNLYNIVTVNRSAISVNGTNQTPAQTVVRTDSTETGMPYFLTGSTTNFLMAWAGSPEGIQKDIGGTVTTLYSNGGQPCYYPIALNSTDFYFTNATSAGYDQVYKGFVSGAAKVNAAFNTTSADCSDAFPMNSTWVAYASDRSGGTGGYDIWIGNFSSGATYNLNSFISGSNHSTEDLGPCFSGTVSTGGGGTSSNLSQGKTATASSTYSGYPTTNANDGSLSSLWCASSGTYPAWWEVDLGASKTITEVDLTFYPGTATTWKYQIQGSTNNSTWTTLIDKSSNTASISSAKHTIASATARYIRIYFTAAPASGDWAALYECAVLGK